MVVEDLHQRNQIVDTLNSTEFGRQVYDDFMARQNRLLEWVRLILNSSNYLILMIECIL